MDNTREKLIDICEQANDELRLRCGCSNWGDFADILIANCVTVQEWISVKERLPEEDIRVLVWVGENDRYFPIIDTDRVHKGRWVRWEEYITHWMPLPPAPKGE